MQASPSSHPTAFASTWKRTPTSVTYLSSLPPTPTTNLLSVSIDLQSLDLSCKWSRTTCGLLWLSSFICCVSMVHLCCGLYQHSFICVTIWMLCILCIYSSINEQVVFLFFVWFLLKIISLCSKVALKILFPIPLLFEIF